MARLNQHVDGRGFARNSPYRSQSNAPCSQDQPRNLSNGPNVDAEFVLLDELEIGNGAKQFAAMPERRQIELALR